MVVMAAYVAVRLLTGQWNFRIVIFTALLAALSVPVNFTGPRLGHLPAGLLSVTAAFILFAFGTALALLKGKKSTLKE